MVYVGAYFPYIFLVSSFLSLTLPLLFSLLSPLFSLVLVPQGAAGRRTKKREERREKRGERREKREERREKRKERQKRREKKTKREERKRQKEKRRK